jgi:NAD(P)-dependent dehydrogenase (short-subunit alcohol dehydrogenase family)
MDAAQRISTEAGMELTAGKVAVVTGAASGIGFALASRFARAGLHVVLADIEQSALAEAEQKITDFGVETLAVPTDVSDEAAVQALAAAAVDRFGAAHVVCNNAGVESDADPWLGPITSWKWVLGVNLWGVIHGIRAFLPQMISQGGGHFVNTASIAGLYPGFAPSYDASKHAVVAISEDLYRSMSQVQLPVGVSVLCPGWVRTNIMDASRNWPASLGEQPPPSFGAEVVSKHVRHAIDDAVLPAAVADLVADAIVEGRFWVFTEQPFVDLVVRRWHGIAERANPDTAVDVPGMPPTAQLRAEVLQMLGMTSQE